MTSKLLHAASQVDVPDKPRAGQATKTLRNISDAEKVAKAIERRFPNAVINEKLIAGQGKTASNVRVVTLAVKQESTWRCCAVSQWHPVVVWRNDRIASVIFSS
jgi:hypothetical protein